jgi:hypothetical protein
MKTFEFIGKFDNDSAIMDTYFTGNVLEDNEGIGIYCGTPIEEIINLRDIEKYGSVRINFVQSQEDADLAENSFS